MVHRLIVYSLEMKHYSIETWLQHSIKDGFFLEIGNWKFEPPLISKLNWSAIEAVQNVDF